MKEKTADEVRDEAREILGLDGAKDARAGVGQLTTFNQLGFKKIPDKPDGWYLPDNKADTAVVLETKASKITLGAPQVKELLKNVRIMNTQYEHVVGILYNGETTRVFKNGEEYREKGSDKLHSIAYYTALFSASTNLPPGSTTAFISSSASGTSTTG